MPDHRPTERAPFHPWGDQPFSDDENDGDDLFGGDGFDGGDDQDDADVSMPRPGYNQHPGEFNDHPHFDPTTNWGNVQPFVIAPNVLGGTVPQPVAQILDATLQMPAVATLRLSAQSLDGIAPAATDFVTWEVMIGVGNATQTRFYKQALSPTDGSVDTDIILTYPVQHLAIRAIGQLTQHATLERRVSVAAQFAPVTSYRGLAR